MEESDQTISTDKKKPPTHRRKWLTLEEKLKIIEANENHGKTSTRIAREQGMNESSVRCILRKKDFYKSLGTSTPFHRYKSFARHRILLLDKVENQLIAWIEDSNQKMIQLTETEIQKKALALFNELKRPGETEKFSASRGWFYRFKNRINLQNCIIPSEKPAPDKVAAKKFQLEFFKIVEEGGYTRHQIFNMDESNLYWKKTPLQSFFCEGEKHQQEYRDTLTVLLGSNATGDLKLKPMTVYRSGTPSALKDCEKNLLPVIWRSNKKTWLTKELFEEYFTDYFCPTVENYCRDKGLEFKVLLLLDCTPLHEVTNPNKNIKIVYLPKHTASLLQPMSLGLFPVLKANYLREILSQTVSHFESNPEESLQDFWLSYNIKNGIDNIAQCWCDLKSKDLAASWHELLPDVKLKDFEDEITNILQDIVARGLYLGFEKIDIKKIQNCIDLKLREFESPITEFEEVICKEETSDLFENEDDDEDQEDLDQQPNIEDLKTILQNVDVACQAILATDFNVERSLKIRQMLQSSIQPYRDLYDEITKQKFKYENNDF